MILGLLCDLDLLGILHVLLILAVLAGEVRYLRWLIYFGFH